MVAAVFTPMKPGGLELDLSPIEAYASHLARANVTSVLPAGTNGESLSLSVAERKALAEAWAKAGPAKGIKVYMHIGCESIVDVIELAKHAASTPGISGVVAMTPVYFKPSLQSLHDFLATVAAAAPQLPIWYYHMPDLTGVIPGDAHQLLELAEQTGKIPNLMGIKFTDYNLNDFSLCTQVAGGKYNMLYGRDEQGMAALMLGADSVISSTINFSPTLREVLRLRAAGNMPGAQAAQKKNQHLDSFFGHYDGNVQKAIMRMVGVDVGPSRLPKTDLTEAQFSALEATLRKEGLIDAAPPSAGILLS